MYYIFNFILYSFLGFILEIIFKLSFNFKSHSGILYGPYCPVYGFGIVFIFYLFEKIEKKFRFNIFLKYFLFFISAFLILSIFEFIGGYLIEFLFHKTFWDYTRYLLNVGKYVTIEMSFMWAIGSILAYKFVKPFFDKLYFKINKNIIKFIFLIMLIDAFLTLIFKFK